MVCIIRIAALLLACAPAALRAQDGAVSCDDARTQMDMNACAAIAFQAADSALNDVYPRVLAQLRTDTSRARLLRQAQRQWIRLRDADCEVDAAAFEGGTLAPMIYAYCQAEMTRARVAHLRTLMAAPTGEADARGAVIDATHRLFAAMEARDTAALRTLMHPRAQIVSVSSTGVTVRSADEWMGGLGRTPDALIERMWDPRVDVDGDLATLWAPYDFHLGERFSHCGTDAFQFIREGGAWKLISITFTRRTTGCEGAP